MRLVIFFVSAWSAIYSAAQGADESSHVPPDRVVGTVYGRVITAADICLTKPIDVTVKFDARDAEHWELMTRILTSFGQPIVDRFVKDRKVEATEEELARFHAVSQKLSERNMREREVRLAEIEKELQTPDLAESKRSALQEEQELDGKIVASLQKSLDDNVRYDEVSKMFILAWKTERELYRVYGGSVIFQQMGCEALDGRRLLWEEAEKKGDVKFDDPGVRHMFYYYANMKHPGGTTDGKVFEQTPWFFEDPK